MLNWIVWNGTVFDFETVLTLNWIMIYRYTIYGIYMFWHLTKYLLILNWISWIRTVWLNWIAWNRNVFEIQLTICIKIDLVLNNLQRLICHKTQPNNHQVMSYVFFNDFMIFTSKFYIFMPNFIVLSLIIFFCKCDLSMKNQ